jgi:hypothetical protein
MSRAPNDAVVEGRVSPLEKLVYAYIQEFSPAVRNIFDSFEFHTRIDRLAKAGLLYRKPSAGSLP